MKKITLLSAALFIASLSFSQYFQLLDSNPEQLVFTHQLKTVPLEVTGIGGQQYVDFTKSHRVTTLEHAAPQVPTFSESVILPAKGSTSLVVEYDSYTELSDVYVSPSKGNLKRNVDPASVPYEFGPVYTQDAFYPGQLAKASEPFIMRSLRGQTVTFYPYQYNPVTKKLRIYENLRVRVMTDAQAPGINELTKAPKKKASTFSGDFFLNKPLTQKYTPIGEEGEMLIICDDDLLDEIQPLVRWKNQKGISVTVTGTSVAGTTATAVKSYIQNFYEDHEELLYILLVGDHQEIPAYSYGTSGGEDLWSDSYYGQLAGSDYYPEAFVGRLSGNSAQITTQVERVLEYEKNPAEGDWMTRAIGLGSGEGSGIGNDDEADWQHLRNIRTRLMDFGYTQVAEFYDGSRGGEDAAGNPSSSIILPVVNEGAGLFNYTGHGDINLCVTGNFTSTNINSATNNGKYPFVISVACNNGTFVYGNCISEAWLRATKNGSPTGAIAACGSSILMAWAQPMQTQDEMAELIAESYADNRKNTLGGLFYNGQMSMLEEYPNGADGREVMQTWVFFGDPSVVFRNQVTQNMTVTHVSQVPQSTTAVDISCDAEGATVSISQDNVFLGKGTVSGGMVTISFPALTTDMPLTVTATKQNYRPYQGNIQVGNGPLEIEEQTLEGLAVYPNPADELLNVELTSDAASADLRLFDMTGKMIASSSVEGSGTVKATLSTEHIAPGAYQLIIRSGDRQSVKKIIIQ